MTRNIIPELRTMNNYVPLINAIPLTLICIKWVTEDPGSKFLVTISTRKIPECSDSMNSSILMPENIWYHYFTWSGLNSQEILNFVLIYFESLSTNYWNKIHNFFLLWSKSGKIMIKYIFYHENRGKHGIWAFLHFLSKTGRQKYSAWVPGVPMIYVKEKSFCLFNWVFSFVGLGGPISCSYIAKIFNAYEG